MYKSDNSRIIPESLGIFDEFEFDDVKFDRRNFANKMLKLGLLTEQEERITMPNKKIAYLYKFNPESYNEMKEKGFRLEF